MPDTTEHLLDCISQLQRPDGLFPATRLNPAWFYKRLDTNVFFTAITVFCLQQVRARLSANGQLLADTVIGRAVPAYRRFRNKDGLNTYNFYQTSPSAHFSGGYLFHHFKHFQLPDDTDDTALIYLTAHPTPDELHWLKDKLSQHANGTDSPAPNTFPEYRSLTAYSTWFGKNMPVELDACVLSNVLYCITQYHLPRNRHDTDSLTFLRSIVETDQYRTDPFRCAHNYARPSLIMYHLARLMATFDPPELRSVREKLVADAHQELARVPNRMDKLLLATSLLRLGQATPALDLTAIETDFADFHFFIAGMLSAYPQPWLYRHAHRPFWHIRWQCEAHNWALVLEYTVLADRF